jgi:hypothetical protein
MRIFKIVSLYIGTDLEIKYFKTFEFCVFRIISFTRVTDVTTQILKNKEKT